MISTKVVVIACCDIPISYKDWHCIDPTITSRVVMWMGKYFEYDYQESIDTEYTRQKLNNCWKTYKSKLYKDYIEDQNPSIVRENVPEGHSILLEDWQIFVDYCNSEEYQEDVNHYMTVCLESRVMGVYDALVMATAPDRRGRFRGMGPWMSKTQLRMTNSISKKNTMLMEKNSELENKISNMDAKIEEKKVEVTELRALILREGRAQVSNVASPHSQNLGHAVVGDNAFMGKECNLRGCFPFRTVADAIVQVADPYVEFCGMRLGEQNYKVYVPVVYEPDFLLPLPHNDYCTALGQLGQGSIIWPKEGLQLKN